ncbi:hypothetical protein HanXRQr2_Chr04g0172421 [Helianthus annuus]|uniref:Uncharacterized protein n=1 Tax=Helianthus annuus TaxID=4232 RepID=A0A9K3NS00_HELAN|nr:hypothetical protein HanXRQr2_Chr04g0172421 [Helianthus annuus]KAJ0931796.1 hypothetical protein HanPSC8_Chr04g0166071 [Helianthus annuus]
MTSFRWALSKDSQRSGSLTLRRSVSPNFAISQLSITILPVSNSTIRNKALSMLDFPAPVLPTIPTLSLGGIEKDKPCSTDGSSGLYLKVTFSNFIDPEEGQPGGGRLSSITPGASDGNSI